MKIVKPEGFFQGPGVRDAVSRPHPLRVRFAEAEGICQTLEGAVRYGRGDALIAGLDGEQWPVARSRFLSVYEPTGENDTTGVPLYIKRQEAVQAVQLSRVCKIDIEGGSLEGRIGDWLVRYSDGDYGVVSERLFQRLYEIKSS